jgi:hypothetical protein
MHFTIALPIADRRASFDFYRQALRLTAVGPVADDGLPEPLAFELADGVQLMLIPADGFAGVIGEHRVAGRGLTECLLDVAAWAVRGGLWAFIAQCLCPRIMLSA